MKLLIVDDEPLIREGLRTLLDWRSMGWEIIGEAENGQTGMEAILALKPDLAIVDIRMPRMDGLTMVEQLRQAGSTCRIILLTAYSDFRLARQAIELGVEAYILKPIDEEELEEKIRRIGERLTEDRQRELILNRGRTAVMDWLLESLAAHGRLPADASEKDRTALGLPWSVCQIILLQLERPDQEIQTIRDSVLRETAAFLQEKDAGYVFQLEGLPVVLLRNVTLEDNPRLVADLPTRIRNRCGCSVVLVVGPTVPGHARLPESLAGARRLQELRFLYGHRQIVSGEVIEPADASEAPDPTTSDPVAAAIWLFDAMDAGNEAIVHERLELIRTRFIRRLETEDAVKLFYANTLTAMANRIAETLPALRSNTLLRENVSLPILEAASLQDLHGFVKYRLSALTERMEKEKPDTQIQRILAYIDRHCATPLRLEEIARLFNYNSSYLGKLFRSSTGMYFNAWLEKVRMEKAKELLASGLKVREAAERVGFTDQDYFYKKFRKYAGKAPSEFRSSGSAGGNRGVRDVQVATGARGAGDGQVASGVQGAGDGQVATDARGAMEDKP